MNKRTTFEHVVCIGCDGAGTFFRQAKTPNIDRIFANGATTYDCLTSNPTISAQSWGSMLIGAAPDVHGLTNQNVVMRPYNDKSQYPTFFRRIREAMPEAVLCAYSCWTPINTGIIEQTLDVDFVSKGDTNLTEDIIAAFRREKAPTVMFVQFDSTDGYGHAYGYGSQEHLDGITRLDEYIGRIYDTIVDVGIADKTLFIVTADHGGTPTRNHGGWSKAEREVFLACTGKGICHGQIGKANVRDISSIVLYALGLDVPAYEARGYTGQIPSGIFADEGIPDYIDNGDVFDTDSTRATPEYKSENGLVNFIDESKLKAAMFLDTSAQDESGKTDPYVVGHPKYYSIGVFGSYSEMGEQGHYVIPDVKFNKNFTISFWLYCDDSIFTDNVLCGNKPYTPEANEKGWILVICPGYIMLNCGNGEQRCDCTSYLPLTGKNGWVHIAITVDFESGCVLTYFNFKKSYVDWLNKWISADDFLAGDFRIGNDASDKFNTQTFNMDDFLIFDGALSPEEIERLGKYYNQK